MPTEIITQPNIWRASEWGSITDPGSTPPIGWQYNVSVWEYVGPTATGQNNVVFQTSTATCAPPPNVYSSQQL